MAVAPGMDDVLTAVFYVLNCGHETTEKYDIIGIHIIFKFAKMTMVSLKILNMLPWQALIFTLVILVLIQAKCRADSYTCLLLPRPFQQS